MNVLVAVVLCLPLVVFRIPIVSEGLMRLVGFMQNNGALGVALYTVSYCIAAVFAAPIVLFHGLAGYVYAASGKMYAIALMVNNGDPALGRPALDAMVEWLARNG